MICRKSFDDGIVAGIWTNHFVKSSGNMENLLVILIVGLALAVLGNYLLQAWRSAAGAGTCCRCGGCSRKSACQDLDQAGNS